MRIRSRAFTLIELLIVVAIIAILAAIALPNFLEAQVRAKISRTHADLAVIATAMESYAVDNNAYPQNDLLSATLLTTPVSYMSTSDLVDPFAKEHDSFIHYAYGYANIAIPPVDQVLRSVLADPAKADKFLDHSWVFLGRGPDNYFLSQSDPQDLAFTQIPRFFNAAADGTGLYDPTNGTISFGDIIRTRHGIATRPLAQ